MSPDEQLEAIRALQSQVASINQKASNTVSRRSNTQNVTNMSVGVKPYFISPVVVQSSTTSDVSWTTFNASSYVKSGTAAVILECEYNIDLPDSGSDFPHVRIRADSSKPDYLLSYGQASSGGDRIGGSNQGLFPLSGSRRFDYEITTPGFNLGCEIRLIGYWA